MPNVTSPASSTINGGDAARFLEQRALVLETQQYFADAAIYWRSAAGLWNEAGKPNRAAWALDNAARCDDQGNPEHQAPVRQGRRVRPPISELANAPED